MKVYLRAVSIEQFCQTVEEQVCNTTDCDHLGASCEAAGCDNHVCRMHENYCSGCELRYCESCLEGHQEGCPGPPTDEHDLRLEQALMCDGPVTSTLQSESGCRGGCGGGGSGPTARIAITVRPKSDETGGAQ